VSQTEIGFEVPPPRASKRASPLPWIALIALGVLSGAGGFYASHHTSTAAVAQPPPALPSEEEKTIVVEPPPPAPPPVESTSATTTPADSVAPVRRRPARDPLTL
jgi:hypothetical protein